MGCHQTALRLPLTCPSIIRLRSAAAGGMTNYLSGQLQQTSFAVTIPNCHHLVTLFSQRLVVLVRLQPWAVFSLLLAATSTNGCMLLVSSKLLTAANSKLTISQNRLGGQPQENRRIHQDCKSARCSIPNCTLAMIQLDNALCHLNLH